MVDAGRTIVRVLCALLPFLWYDGSGGSVEGLGPGFKVTSDYELLFTVVRVEGTMVRGETVPLGTGVFISKNVVLTAASILANQTTLYVRYGVIHPNDESAVSISYSVVHPQFKDNAQLYNLALLTLKEEFVTANPIGLRLDDRHSYVGTDIELASYGVTSRAGTAAPAGYLHTTSQIVVDSSMCPATAAAPSFFVCAYNPINGAAPCTQDIGAPVYDARSFSLIAIVYHVQSYCSPILAKNYLRISRHLPWIMQELATR